MNRKMKAIWTLLVASAFMVSTSACDDEEGPITPPMDEPPEIEITEPFGAEAFDPGSTVQISWTATDDQEVTGVTLSYTADGVAETEIAAGLTSSPYDWTVPSENLFGVKVKAVATDNAGQTASDENSQQFAIVAASARGYVTSTVCQNCHADKWDDLFQSGHPYKLNKVVNDQPPTYPNSEVPTPPQGFAWSDITYVIGGYGWKARFLNDSGFILTTGIDGVPTQLNLERTDLGGGLDTVWVSYHSSDTERKPYTCGTCHTTGWQDLTQNGGVNQDGLPGIFGTWEETGISCERCHSAGVDHVVSQSTADINKNDEAGLCGSCHFRDTNHNILASGGYIRHHEQFDELLGAKKADFDCTQCHEPHIGTRYGSAAQGGIVETCEDCHTGTTLDHVAIDCESCHMGRASKSARAVHTFEGDVRTHIFKINTNAVGKDQMFFIDPETGNTHTRGFITLDFACYSCHTDPLTMEGGGGSEKTLDELSAKALVIHQ